MKRLIYLFIMCLSAAAYGQSLTVFDVDPSAFPTIKAKFYAIDKSGKQITDLDKSDFAVSEDGNPRVVTGISCPDANKPVPLSVVITIDASASMEGKMIDLAKQVANKLVDLLPVSNTEIAVTKFNSGNAIIQDFTTDKNRLKNKINSLVPDNGTDFDAGFINQMSGALLIADKGKYRKVVVFITDGFAEGTEKEIISKAKEDGTMVVCVVLGGSAPPVLKNIADQTEGKCLDNIQNKEKTAEICTYIESWISGRSYCTIEWLSDKPCFPVIDYIVRWIGPDVSSSGSYRINDYNTTKLEIQPYRLEFADCQPGKAYTRNIVVTAKNGDITLSDIKINNSRFEIIGDYKGKTIKQGETIILTVRYNCIDDSRQSAYLTFESDACQKTIFYAVGNADKGGAVSSKIIKVLAPNGLERFKIKSDTTITWDYEDPTFPIILDFSSDRGATWANLTNKALDGSFDWKNLPATPSDDCLIRASAVDSLDELHVKSFIFTPDFIRDMEYNAEGTKIALACPNYGVAVFDVSEKRAVLALPMTGFKDFSLTFSPTGRYLAVSGNRKNEEECIYIWDVFREKLSRKINNADYYYFQFSPDETWLYGVKSGSSNIFGCRFESEDSMRALFNCGDGTSPGPIYISVNNYLAVEKESNLNIYDLATRTIVLKSSEIIHKYCLLGMPGFSPDGKYIGFLSDDNEISVIDIDSRSDFLTIKLQGNYDENFRALFSNDGKYIVTYERDSTVRFYGFPSGSLVSEYPIAQQDYYYCLALSPDLRHIATDASDFEITDYVDNTIVHRGEYPVNDYTRIYGICYEGNYLIMKNDTLLTSYNMVDGSINWQLPIHTFFDYPDNYNFNISSDCGMIAYVTDTSHLIHIIDAATAKEISVIYDNELPTFPVVRFSNDNKFLMIPDYDRIYRYSLDTYKKIESVYMQDYSISYLIASPVNDNVLIFHNSKMTLYDMDARKEIFTITSMFIDADFSPDGNFIAASFNNQYATVYDAENGNVIMEETPFGATSRLTFVGFSPDGSMAAWVCSAKDTIVIYDAHTWQMIKKKYCPYYGNDNYWFSNDEIISAYKGELFLVSNINDRKIIASDLSDTTFSIVCPELDFISSENLGNVLYGTRKDIIIKDFFVNNDDFPITVQSLTLSDTTVKILAPAVPFTLQPGERKNLEIYVIPDKYDSVTIDVNFETECRQMQSKLRYNAIPPELKVLTAILDFGEVWVGQAKTLNRSLIRNVSNRDIEITKIYLAGPDIVQFSFVAPSFPVVIPAGSELPFDMSFLPQYYGRTCTDIVFEFNGAGSPVKAQLFGEGIGETVFVASDSARPGKGFNLRLMTTGGRPESMSSVISNFNAKLRFQKSILTTRYQNANISRTVTGDSTVVTINGEIDAESNLLFSVPAIAGLGTVTQTPVEILEFNWLDKEGNILDYDTKFADGSFKLLGICYEGGQRMVEPDAAVAMAIRPIPANDRVDLDFFLIEKGYTEIAVYNILGEKLLTVFSEDVTSPGKREIGADLRALTAGQYVMVLKTPTIMMNYIILKVGQ